MINVPSQILLFSCRVIAISGDSGSGKSRLCESLNQLFEGNQILKLETDRYHKWERGDPNYETYTHLDPAANYLQKMEDDVYNLILGDRVLAVDYDHSTGRFTPLERIHSKENIILCGLHTLWSSNLQPLLNLKIFMDTDRELIQEWKIQRDMKKRGKTLEHVKKEMVRRQNDYVSYIKTQRDIADIIIKFYKQTADTIGCRCIFKNFDSNFLYMLQMCGYTIDCTSNLQIELKGKSDSMKKCMKSILVNPDKIEEGFYGEIQLIINFLEKYKHGTVIF
jgi:uridine kinase